MGADRIYLTVARVITQAGLPVISGFWTPAWGSGEAAGNGRAVRRVRVTPALPFADQQSDPGGKSREQAAFLPSFITVQSQWSFGPHGQFRLINLAISRARRPWPARENKFVRHALIKFITSSRFDVL